MTDTIQRAKIALWDRYRKLNPNIKVDKRGYIENSKHNLLQPEWMELIIKDYEEGGGKELELKFRAVHSSAALVANNFARFKKETSQLVMLGQSGFNCVVLEKKLPTGFRGIPPNLDVFLENSNVCIAIESKLLETLSLKPPHFSSSYNKERLPNCEPQWWDFIESAPNTSGGYLDTAQLVKHYLGLLNYIQKKVDHKPVLLYLYWKPVNAQEIEEYQIHERQIRDFKNKVVGSRVEFVPMSYPELWEVWSKDPSIADHAKKLLERYYVSI
jgi:hypothetical protein